MSRKKTSCFRLDYCMSKRDAAAAPSICICDLFALMDECEDSLSDDWKPDRQRVEEIAAEREGRKPRKIR